MPILRIYLLAVSLVLAGLTQTVYAAAETDALSAVLASRNNEDKARDEARQPLETTKPATAPVTPTQHWSFSRSSRA